MLLGPANGPCPSLIVSLLGDLTGALTIASPMMPMPQKPAISLTVSGPEAALLSS